LHHHWIFPECYCILFRGMGVGIKFSFIFLFSSELFEKKRQLIYLWHIAPQQSKVDTDKFSDGLYFKKAKIYIGLSFFISNLIFFKLKHDCMTNMAYIFGKSNIRWTILDVFHCRKSCSTWHFFVFELHTNWDFVNFDLQLLWYHVSHIMHI
jgi:hypothetical protein